MRASKAIKNLPFWPALEQFQESLSGGTKRERLESLVEHAERAEQLDADARGASELLATIQRTLIERRRAEGTLGFGDVLRLARDGLRDQPGLAKRTPIRRSRCYWSTSFRIRAACSATCSCSCVSGQARSSAGSRAKCRARKTSWPADWWWSAIASSRFTPFAADVSVFAQLAAELAGAPAARQLELSGVLPSSAPVAEFHTLTANYRSTRAIIDAVNCIARADFNERPSVPSRSATRPRRLWCCRPAPKTNRAAR